MIRCCTWINFRQLGGPGGIATSRLRLEQRDIVLHPLDVAPADAAPEARPQPRAEPRSSPSDRNRERGTDTATHCGAVRLLPPAVTSNSSRRFWAYAVSSFPGLSGLSSP